MRPDEMTPSPRSANRGFTMLIVLILIAVAGTLISGTVAVTTAMYSMQRQQDAAMQVNWVVQAAIQRIEVLRAGRDESFEDTWIAEMPGGPQATRRIAVTTRYDSSGEAGASCTVTLAVEGSSTAITVRRFLLDE